MSIVSGAVEPFRLTRTGAARGAADLDRLRDTFDRQHCVKLPGFLETGLLRQIHRLVETAEFAEFVHEDVASELKMQHGVCSGALDFLVNDPRLFAFVREVSGCPPIRAFVGRVYRRYPGTHHHDSWHTDLMHHRLVGLSVNLSTAAYEGGTFEIRRFDAEAKIVALPNVGAGDAILFRIAEGFEHQVTAVRGTLPKTAFAGWFVGYPPAEAGERAARAQ